jgi:4-aminobutyrate aminotransferase-like enzyme
VFVSPFPYAYHYGWDEETTTAFCLDELDRVLHGQSAPDETAAFIIEPVLGEGGYVPAPPAFLEGLRQIADEHGILLVVDEVQSGFGRTGKFFGYQHADVLPDIIIMAKGLGSGMPISGIAASAELMNKWRPGTHGGTYGGGNALAAAAAAATIDVIREEKLVEHAALMGGYLMARLTELQAEFPVIGDVRGHGLMIATEFTGEDGKPDPDTTKAVAQAALKQRLMLLTCGTYGNVIRWIPPLIVNAEQIDEALSIFENVLKSI